MGKVCVVVGLGKGGIGDACAAKFSAEGYDVAMLARTKDKLDELEKKIPRSKGFVCDVCNVEQSRQVVKDIVSVMGPIDVLIYNAGSGVFKNIFALSDEDFEAAWMTGPRGLFVFAKAVAPAMVERGSGVIGITGATASWRGMPFTPGFAPSKFGVRALAQSLARELGPKGVHVFHAVIDGVVDLPGTIAAKPDTPKEKFLSSAATADTYFTLATQPKGAWTFEVNLAPAAGFDSMVTI